MRRRSNQDWIATGGRLALLLLLVGGPVWGAATRLAELEAALAQATAAERPALLVSLSAAVEPDDTARALEYAQQARKEALTPADEIRADTRIAALLRRRGSYPEAMKLAEGALVRAERLGDDILRGDAMLVIAHTHDSQANFPAALDLFRKLMLLAEARGDPTFLARVHGTMGITYADAEQLDRAKESYDTALAYARKTDDQRMVASLLNNLGNVAMETDNAPLAREYHEKALALRLSIGSDARGIADSNQNLAHVSMMENRPAEALPYLDRAIPVYVTLGLKRNLANAQLGYADALTMLRRFDEVPAHLDIARQLATELNSPTILVRVHRISSQFHEARGDLRAALDAERQLAIATDKAIGERSRLRLDALQARFDAERRQHEIDVLRRDQQLQQAELAAVRWQRYSLAVALVGVMALATAIISRQRLKRQTEARILAEARAGREAAEAANALKSRLLSMVSHDIRGPLGGMLHVFADMSEDHPAIAGDERFRIITKQARQVQHLAEDLLDSAALEAGQLKIEPAPADLAETVRSSLALLQPIAARKSQFLEIATPSGPCEVVCDARRISQVVANLVSNAIKFSPRKTPIRITLERQPGIIRLQVSDRGPGIPPEKLATLFVPFTRLTTKPTAGESSHGLGLSIAHDLVRLHQGRISVESKPGQGATFTVELPA